MNDPSRIARAPCEVIVVGAGKRARAWSALLVRSSVARVVGRVARDAAADAVIGDAPRFDDLRDALAAFPAARVAAALAPRAALEAALLLAEGGRAGLVEAPLHGAVAHATFGPSASAIEVAHGWVTLAGRAWFERALTERAAERITIEAHGLPEEAGGDVDEVLVHALALALRLSPRARVATVTHATEARIEVVLSTDGGLQLVVDARAEGQGLDVRAEGASFELGWKTQGDVETLSSRLGTAPREARSQKGQPAEVRALRQLVDPAQGRGDTLLDAREVARCMADVAIALGRRPALGGRALRQSAQIARARPLDLLAQLGLVGELPHAERAATFHVPTPPEPLELWPFRAGKKPVVFLTAAPADVARLVGYFDGAHVERRERRVLIGVQDAWADRRDVGEPRVELYISRDRAAAERAASVQTEQDPSRSLRELGELMGYPTCCVEAFAAQADRSNNTRNRYATAARTAADAPWPWELANLHTMVIPCYPCSYACSAALDLARSALHAMDAAHPGSRRAIAEELARPTLYFDHERQLVLHGTADASTVRYAGVSVPEWTSTAFASFAGAIAAGDELTFTDDALSVRAAGREIIELRRTDPGLGFLAPFG